MPHIHDKPGQHDLVVSMYIVRTDFDEPKIMLHYHKKLNSWMQFGGHVELDEDPWQAVIHELKEESGYDISQLKILQPKNRLAIISDAKLHPQPFVVHTHYITKDHMHTALDYAFITDQEPKYDIGENESVLVKSVNRDELEALNECEIFSSTKDICLYIFDELLNDWQAVETSDFNEG